jgi:hypothetical protein
VIYQKIGTFASMKRFVLYLFIIQFATGHNPIVEVLRMSNLVEHYREHQAQKADISIVEFLQLHYLDEKHHEADTQHENLPMHCHAEHFASSIFVIEDFNYFFVKNTISTIVGFPKKQSFFYDNQLISNYLASILQPPRYSPFPTFPKGEGELSVA